MRIRVGGFTLIELMVTVMIVAVLLSIAVPSFRDTIARSRVASGASALSAAFTTAKSEAGSEMSPWVIVFPPLIVQAPAL